MARTFIYTLIAIQHVFALVVIALGFFDLWVDFRKLDKQLDKQTRGIDYRKAVKPRPWPFQEFADAIAELLGEKAGLSSFNTDQLEALKKVFNQSLLMNRSMVKSAFENAAEKSIPFIIYELKQIIKQPEGHTQKKEAT